MKITWLPRAIQRASEIARHIAQDDAEAATRWVDGLFETTAILVDHPYAGRMVPELGREEIRELLYHSYRIVYKVESKRIGVLTVRHARRSFDDTEID